MNGGETINIGLKDAFLGGALSGVALGIAILVIVLGFLAYWVYTSFAWMTIAKKLKYRYPWLAWIPFARTSMIFELRGFHWALVFLYLVPILGWIAILVLTIVSSWYILEKRKYHGWLSLLLAISSLPILGESLMSLASIGWLVVLGLVAWKDKK
ncbi:MAG TPA: hypothetical protein VJ912_02545 [Candidatus Nanoarchaeia archaeon]|nr:hypothetical protein [Candidatus Nanoarchaeia archaeon]